MKRHYCWCMGRVREGFNWHLRYFTLFFGSQLLSLCACALRVLQLFKALERLGAAFLHSKHHYKHHE